MDGFLPPLLASFRLNTRLYLNCLEGMDDETARRRIDGRTNSAAFIALHLVDARHLTARVLGMELENPFAAMLESVRGIDDLPRIPPLDEIRRAWVEVSDAVERRLAGLTQEELQAPSPQRFPVDDGTLAGGICFLTTHDSYHVGQMALLRKHLGLGAMGYT